MLWKGLLIKNIKNLQRKKKMPKVFAWSPIKELMKSCGAEMVSREAVDELISYLESVAKELTSKALELSRHAQRKKLTEDDMKLAIALE
jgi:histone H3/H4